MRACKKNDVSREMMLRHVNFLHMTVGCITPDGTQLVVGHQNVLVSVSEIYFKKKISEFLNLFVVKNGHVDQSRRSNK